MSINAYPLQWPVGWKRTEPWKRQSSRFKRPSMDDGSRETIEQLRMMSVSRQDVVISTNVKVRLDGLPYSNQPQPSDCGVAVYFRRARRVNGSRVVGDFVIACDNFNRVEDNLWAIAKTLEAMRAIERYGAEQITDRTFTGFAALPEKMARRRCWDVFAMPENCPTQDLFARYKDLARTMHPDSGGSHELFIELGEAWDEIKRIRNIA